MAVLVLDAEALSALARPYQNARRHERIRAAIRSAYNAGHPVRVPAAVLVEVYRGGGTDEAIDRVLGQGFARVITTGARIARIAGHMLASAGSGSELAIDALVVATAVRLGGGIVLTHDPVDLAVLATRHANVSVEAIQ